MPKGIPNKRYTPEFKQMVVETMREEHLSVREAMRRFEISDHGIIERWERIYLEEGPCGHGVSGTHLLPPAGYLQGAGSRVAGYHVAACGCDGLGTGTKNARGGKPVSL